MRSIRQVSYFCSLLIIGLAAPAAAQSVSPGRPALFGAAQGGGTASPHVRDGLWFNAGLGIGSLGCEDCGDRETSLGLDLAVGGTVTPRLLVGGGISGWSKEENGFTLTVATLEARLRFYPNVESGLFLIGGLGLGSIRAEFNGVGDETESGAGLTIGAGWDIRVGRNVSITPYWTGTAVTAGDSDANFGQLGVAVTIH